MENNKNSQIQQKRKKSETSKEKRKQGTLSTPEKLQLQKGFQASRKKE